MSLIRDSIVQERAAELLSMEVPEVRLSRQDRLETVAEVALSLSLVALEAYLQAVGPHLQVATEED